MQTWPNASCLLGLAGAAAAAEVAPQNLFVWNPHWQCFVWNQNECAEHVVEALNMFLVAFDVDFATVIELADSTYQSPTGWEFIVGKCGHDLVNLFYNTLRWTPLGSQNVGCMEDPEDRPYVIQPFVGASGEKVIVVGAHFPHPKFSPELSVYEATAKTKHLREALAEVRQQTHIEKIVLMADTNAWSWISNEMIWQRQLDLPGSLVSTRLMNTCCLDADFPDAFTFDRIMANFGDAMQSTALYMGDLPNWTHQVNGTKIGAFHRPVFARVELLPQQSSPTAVWIAMILFLVTTIVLAVTLFGFVLRKICKKNRQCVESSSSFSSEEEQLS